MIRRTVHRPSSGGEPSQVPAACAAAARRARYRTRRFRGLRTLRSRTPSSNGRAFVMRAALKAGTAQALSLEEQIRRHPDMFHEDDNDSPED